MARMMNPAMERKVFMLLVAVAALNMIAFSRDFMSSVIDFDIAGFVKVGTLVGLVLLYGLKKYYDRDL